MSDSKTLIRKLGLVAQESGEQPGTAKPSGGEDNECACFGFLQGISARALVIEFCLSNGNSEAFPYSGPGPVR